MSTSSSTFKQICFYSVAHILAFRPHNDVIYCAVDVVKRLIPVGDK